MANTGPVVEISQELRDKFQSHLWRLENLYPIKTKAGEVKFMKLNRAQREYVNQETKRDIVCKARQIGMSTLKLIQLLDRTIWIPNTTSVVIAHHQKSLEKLFRIVKFAYDNYPKEYPKPRAKYDNKNELVFPEINSSIYISLEVRGDAVNNLHISELAFMEDAESRVVSSMAALVPTGRMSIESTSNGVGNYFYDFFTTASERGFAPFFFPWFYADEYRLPANGSTFNYEERDYQKRHKLDDAQLTWWKQNRALFKERFCEVYPSTAEESFLSAGNAVFPTDTLNNLKVKKPIIDQPDMKVWEHPRYGGLYAVGVDPAEGIIGQDEHSVDVIDVRSGEQVAHFSGYCSLPMLAEKVATFAKTYNNALVIPEANNHGFALIAMLNEMKVKMYRREKFDSGTRPESSDKVGWLTTSRTKSIMISQIVKALYDNDIKINHVKTISQMKTYQYLSDGSMGAASGKHDDCLAPGTLILTEKGYKSVENVQVGERVLTHLGNWKPVEKLLKKQFDGTMYRAKFGGMSDIHLTYNHPIFAAKEAYRHIKGKTGGISIGWKKREWVLPGDWKKSMRAVSVIPTEKLGQKNILDVAGSRNMKEIVLDKTMASFLGLFLAEGCCNKLNKKSPYRMSLAFHSKELPKAEQINKWLGSLGVPARVYQRDGNALVLEFQGKLLWTILSECYDDRHEKRLPGWAVDLAYAFPNEIVNAWLDGDGWKYKDHKIGATTSRSLALTMRDLAMKAGRYASIVRRKRHRYEVATKDQYWVEVWNGWPPTAHGKKISKHEIACATKSVEPYEYHGDVYNLQVADDRSFVAEGIVVHNCVMSLALAWQGIRVVPKLNSRPAGFSRHEVGTDTYAQVSY